MKNGKKPADQQSTNGANGAGDAVDLETELDDDEGTGADSEDDDEDDDDDSGAESSGGGSGDIQSQIAAAVAAAVKKVEQKFTAETDRRVNQALAKQRKKLGVDEDDDDEDEGQKPKSRRNAQPAADIRSARLVFREELPEHIKILGPEERELANQIGQSLIRSRGFEGFDDADEVGEEAAAQTAQLLKKARDFYSGRTKRVLEKAGALKDQPSGQSCNGGGGKTVDNAFEAARKKDMELHPERYAGQNQ
ncbi:hypothetical protein SEA_DANIELLEIGNACE_15 [Arthrobacter phage DanielleIgnace]|nr:hypothetical protein SEA_DANIELLEIGNACE_15 [Arthrobacter phage DanielleIgnace]